VDHHAFDQFTRAVALPGATRRRFLRGMLGVGAAALVGNRARAVMAATTKKPLCHVTGDPNHPYEIITVAEPAWETHFAHGDTPYVNCCVDADCPPVDACTPGACIAGTCRTTTRCPEDHSCLPDRICAGYDCDQANSDGCTYGYCPCPRVGPFACHVLSGVVDVGEFIACGQDVVPI
jgi:hypothetical protein